MATVAELQKIADEVSEAFHRPTWNIVVVDKGVGKPCEVSSHRIVVPRSWLANPEPAKLRFGLVLFEVFTEKATQPPVSPGLHGHRSRVLCPGSPVGRQRGVSGVVLAVFILLLAGLYGHRAVVPSFAEGSSRRLSQTVVGSVEDPNRAGLQKKEKVAESARQVRSHGN
ncbi:MAG: hypothetical protein U0S12_08385 [Fimbriimonadales bacterium]